MEFVELDADEAESLYQMLAKSRERSGIRKLRISSDGNQVKFKVNAFAWTAPVGHKGEPY